MKNYIKYFAILALGFAACEPEFDEPIEDGGVFDSGEADFSNFVAVGNSLTAGFADNALYLTGQQNSYPRILADQFSLLGGGEFTQPLVNDNAGGLLNGGEQIRENRFVLAFDAEGNPAPQTFTGITPTTDISNTLSGQFNNMGVPGARSFDLGFSGYGNINNLPLANPYFIRFASSPDATVIGDAVAQEPTFFALWIGNNDVLGYATSGGSGVDQTGNLDPETYALNDITDPNVFAASYSSYVDALVGTGADGVLVNIPDVTSVPFFTTVPFAPLDPSNPAFGPQIPTLNATFAQLNQAFAFLGVPERSISFSETAASPVVIFDEDLPDISQQLTQVLIGGGLDPTTATLFGQQYGQARQANESDLLVLTSSGVIATPNQGRLAELLAIGVPQATAQQLVVNGVNFPLEDQFVLTADEQALVAIATASYNATIAGLAEANGLAFVDARSALLDVANGGISFDGGTLSSEFVTGGAFSLDGVHPTPRGYAFTANAIIDAINSTYNSTVPNVNIGDFGTVNLSNSVGGAN